MNQMQALSLSGLKLTSVQLLSDGTEQLWGAGDREICSFVSSSLTLV